MAEIIARKTKIYSNQDIDILPCTAVYFPLHDTESHRISEAMIVSSEILLPSFALERASRYHHFRIMDTPATKTSNF